RLVNHTGSVEAGTLGEGRHAVPREVRLRMPEQIVQPAEVLVLGVGRDAARPFARHGAGSGGGGQLVASTEAPAARYWRTRNGRGGAKPSHAPRSSLSSRFASSAWSSTTPWRRAMPHASAHPCTVSA